MRDALDSEWLGLLEDLPTFTTGPGDAGEVDGINPVRVHLGATLARLLPPNPSAVLQLS
jgi:hypothetical protein